MKTLSVCIAVILFNFGYGEPVHASMASNPTTWSELEMICAESEVDSERIGDLIERCKKNNMDPSEAYGMLDPILEACRRGLPLDYPTSKLEEGLAKGISSERISSAVKMRLDYMLTSRELTESVGKEMSADAVIVAAARAMESGMKKTDIRTVLEEGETREARELAYLLEAGENLKLSGFESEELTPILVDCMKRNLRRLEIRRLVRYASQQRKRGMDAGTIRVSLWGNEGNGATERYRKGGDSGTGDGFGPGPGDEHSHRHGRP